MLKPPDIWIIFPDPVVEALFLFGISLLPDAKLLLEEQKAGFRPLAKIRPLCMCDLVDSK